MLETATASLGLMSQRADGELLLATAPHAASYFYLSKGNPRNDLASGVYFRNFIICQVTKTKIVLCELVDASYYKARSACEDHVM